MLKKHKIITFLVLSLTPNIAHATEYIKCGDDRYFPYALVNLVSIFFTIIKIAVPILLVISGMITFLKVTFSSNVDEDMKKAKSKLINNIIAAVIIFFIISIINFAIGLVAGANNKFMSCVNCFINPDKCEKIDKKDDEIKPGIIGNNKKTTTDKKNNNQSNTNQNSNTTENSHQTGTQSESKNLDNFLFIGDSRYILIETQLKKLGTNIKVSAVQGVGSTYWIDNISKLDLSKNKISIMIGVNQINTNEMKRLLDLIHNKNTNAKIYVNSVYHIGRSYNSGYVNNKDIDNYNKEIEQYCTSKDWLQYIDITEGLYESDGYLKNEYTNDGLHMNIKGNTILVNNIKKQITK
ncbi:MAG: hypothetical protein J6D28_02010 [Bacilli bacterium]|nr:hypothetical protein [Bacilli bacterium]